MKAECFFLRRALLFERNCARIADREKNIMNAFTGQTFQMNQLISIKKVIEFTGVSRSTIYEMMDENSPYYDPTFPKKVTISKKRIAWSAWEIHQWIEAKLASRE